MEPDTEDRNLDHNEGMSRRDSEYQCDQMQERPHKKIRVTIRFVESEDDDFAGLIANLKNYNMKVESSESKEDIMIIYGIPPENGFDSQKVLSMVQCYIKTAELVTE